MYEGLMEKNVSGPHGVTAAQLSEQMHCGAAGVPLPQQRPPSPGGITALRAAVICFQRLYNA